MIKALKPSKLVCQMRLQLRISYTNPPQSVHKKSDSALQRVRLNASITGTGGAGRLAGGGAAGWATAPQQGPSHPARVPSRRRCLWMQRGAKHCEYPGGVDFIRMKSNGSQGQGINDEQVIREKAEG
jgi:hypothetical protein